jgi:hypothetical protein
MVGDLWEPVPEPDEAPEADYSTESAEADYSAESAEADYSAEADEVPDAVYPAEPDKVPEMLDVFEHDEMPDAAGAPGADEASGTADGAGNADGASGNDALSAQRRPATGEPRVDEALRRLDELAELPVAEHPAVFEHVHARLRDVLGELDSGTLAGAQGRQDR